MYVLVKGLQAGHSMQAVPPVCVVLVQEGKRERERGLILMRVQ